MKKIVLIICLALLLAGLVLSGSEVQTTAKPPEKVTICHAAGRDDTEHYIELTVGWSAVYGPAGHFYENGTPQAGHEHDYLGPCVGEVIIY